MNELKRNGSGYYDDTAYKAMKNYQEEKEMFENSKEVREGGNLVDRNQKRL